MDELESEGQIQHQDKKKEKKTFVELLVRTECILRPISLSQPFNGPISLKPRIINLVFGPSRRKAHVFHSCDDVTGNFRKDMFLELIFLCREKEKKRRNFLFFFSVLVAYILFYCNRAAWYEGCPKSLASYFFENRKMMLERYPALVI